MNNFSYYNPTRIYFGKGQIEALRKEAISEEKILLLYGGGSIKQNGVYDQVTKALSDRKWVEFGGIEPNPTCENLLPAVELARKENVSFLLAVGGGSVIDGTKFIAAAIPYEGDPWDIVTRGGRLKQVVPLGSVLTLPATGSEMNPSSVISRKSTHEKISFKDPLLHPRFSILDPETTYTVPRRQVANGITDAYVHVLEQYVTYPVGALLQDRQAESILQTLIEVGPKTLENPTDYESRATFMWCTTMALNGLIGAGVPQDWATHAIGHELTALYGIDHARTLAVVMPSLLYLQRDEKHDKLLQYARRVWNINQGSEDEIILNGIERTAAFFESLGIPTHLSAYPEVDQDTPELVAGRIFRRRSTPLGERKSVTSEKVRAILTHSLSTT